MNKLIAEFIKNNFAPADVVASSYNGIRNQNEFAAQAESLVKLLLDPTGDQDTYTDREEATALYIIEIVEGYSTKRDQPAAKASRDCLRTRLNAHLKKHGLKVGFKLKTDTKETRVEFEAVKTSEEEAQDKAAKKSQATPTSQSTTDQIEIIQEEKSIKDQVKILVKLASDLPADVFEQYICTLQLLQIEREDQAKTNLAQVSK